MAIRCDAVVENGLLRPLQDVGLADAERVVLTIERAQRTASPTPSAKELLLSLGLRQLGTAEASVLAGRDLSTIQRDQIERHLPLRIRGKPLSATVIEERHHSW